MASLTLYDITVPVFRRALTSLKGVLQAGEKWCDDNGHPHSKLLEGRIIEDMQIRKVCDDARDSLTRIGGEEEGVAQEHSEKTFADLHERIDQTIALLDGARAEKFKAHDAPVGFKYGARERKDIHFDTTLYYVQNLLLPNFFFHHVTAYDILRAAGVPLGKLTYLDVTTLRFS